MTTPQFIEWLNGKMASYDKLIPPRHILEAELGNEIEIRVRTVLTDRILGEARCASEDSGRVTRKTRFELEDDIRAMFERNPEREWRAHIHAVVEDLVAKL
jgi:hypothetical protein